MPICQVNYLFVPLIGADILISEPGCFPDPLGASLRFLSSCDPIRTVHSTFNLSALGMCSGQLKISIQQLMHYLPDVILARGCFLW